MHLHNAAGKTLHYDHNNLSPLVLACFAAQLIDYCQLTWLTISKVFYTYLHNIQAARLGSLLSQVSFFYVFFQLIKKGGFCIKDFVQKKKQGLKTPNSKPHPHPCITI